jgi:hypothetical protein
MKGREKDGSRTARVLRSWLWVVKVEEGKKAGACAGKCSQLWVVKVREKGKDEDMRTRLAPVRDECLKSRRATISSLGRSPSPARKASPLAPFSIPASEAMFV